MAGLGLGLGAQKLNGLRRPFNPFKYGTVELWWDFTDRTKLNGGSITDGDAITGIVDKSGNAYNGAPTGTVTWQDAGFGTKDRPYAEFLGVDDFFDISSAVSALTIIVVVQKDGVVNKNVIVWDSGDTLEFVATATSATAGTPYSRASGLGANGPSTTVTIPHIITASGAGTTIKTAVNGTFSGDVGGQTLPWTIDKVSDYSSTGNDFDGKICQIIMFSDTLSNANVTDINDALDAEIGIY